MGRHDSTESLPWVALRVAIVVIAALVTAQLLGIDGFAVRLGLVVAFSLAFGFGARALHRDGDARLR